jgi:hypothetical protein
MIYKKIICKISTNLRDEVFFFFNNFIIFFWEEGRKVGEGNSRVILSLLTYQSQSYHFRDKVVFYNYKSHRYFKIRVQQIILYISYHQSSAILY